MKRTLVCLSLGVAGSALSAPIAYVVNTNMTIDKVNAATNASIPYGTTTFLTNSLARTSGGKLISADNAGNLWDVTTVPIPVGPTLRTQIGDLDYANNGLWGFSNATNELFFFDLGSTTVTYSATITLPGAATVTGVAYQPSTGDIYLSANAGLNTDHLLVVPNSSTVATNLGPMVIGDSFSFISDIDFDSSGTLYAMTWFHRYFYTVSTINAATAFVSAGPHRDTTGMALDPVPEPASLAVLGIGALALIRKKHRIG